MSCPVQAVRRAQAILAIGARPRRPALRRPSGGYRRGGGRSRRRRAAERRPTPKRASSGPASRIEARIRVQSSGSRRVEVMSAAHTRTVFSSVQSTSAPMSRISSIMASTSRIRGTFASSTGSPVRRQAARIGSAAFLLPAGRTRPERGTPPSITKVSKVPSLVAVAIPDAPPNSSRVRVAAFALGHGGSCPRWYTRCR